jgi:aminocarboxymuconate-semialdehyde decarboxylase
MIVDIHTHYAPSGLYAAADRGKDWYGASIARDGAGGEQIVFGNWRSGLHPDLSIRDPERRIQGRKDDEGIEFEALCLIGNLLTWVYHLEPRQAAACCREVNQELADLENAYPQSFRGLAVLPMQDRDAALRELEHVVKDLDMRSIVIGTTVLGKLLDDPTLLPVLEAAAEAGVFINTHPPLFGVTGSERLPRYFFTNSFGAPLESSIAVMSIIYSGLLDRHPDVKISFRQAGGWVLYGVGRFSLRYHQREDARPMAEPPEAYLGRLYYDCLIHDSDSLQFLVNRVGADHVMLGTDNPAGGGIIGGTVRWIREQPYLSETDKTNILGGNAARLLGLETTVPA